MPKTSKGDAAKKTTKTKASNKAATTKKKRSPPTYDEVFRGLMSDFKPLIIPMLNEIFGEDYCRDQNVELLQNEIIILNDGKIIKKITDSCIKIVKSDGTVKKYHLECQSSEDGTMAIRMYEYDSQIALIDQKFENGHLELNFPESAVLCLRHTDATPDVYNKCAKSPRFQPWDG